MHDVAPSSGACRESRMHASAFAAERPEPTVDRFSGARRRDEAFLPWLPQSSKSLVASEEAHASWTCSGCIELTLISNASSLSLSLVSMPPPRSARSPLTGPVPARPPASSPPQTPLAPRPAATPAPPPGPRRSPLGSSASASHRRLPRAARAPRAAGPPS